MQGWHSSHRLVGTYVRQPEENAMKTVCSFLAKFANLIVCSLHCFDGVIFKGHLALAAPSQLATYVDWILRVGLTDFMKIIAPQYSDRLVEHARAWARKDRRTYDY
jgi:hypothetical protein